MSSRINLPGLAPVTIYEKSPLVLDIGSEYTKYGYASQCVPTKITPTRIYDVRTRKYQRIFDTNNTDDLNDGRIYQFLLNLFKEVGCNTKIDIVIVDTLMTPSKFRDILARQLFEELASPSILFVSAPLMACLPFRVKTALVVDMGASDCSVVPVVNSVVDLGRWQASKNCSGRSILLRTKELLVKYAKFEKLDIDEQISTEQKQRLITDDVAQDVIVRMSFATRADRGLALQEFEYLEKTKPNEFKENIKHIEDTVAPIQLRLENGSLLVTIPGFVQEIILEPIFGGLTEDFSLPQMICECIVKSSYDSRKDLAGHILLSGGLAHVRGLRSRLLHEINACRENLYKTKLFNDSNKENKSNASDIFKFLYFEGEPLYNSLPWIGGSIIGQTEYMKTRAFTRETFEKWGKRVPDWSDFTNSDSTPIAYPVRFPGEKTLLELHQEESPAIAYALKRAREKKSLHDNDPMRKFEHLFNRRQSSHSERSDIPQMAK